MTYSIEGPQLLMSSSLVRTAIVLSEESLWSNYYLVEKTFNQEYFASKPSVPSVLQQVREAFCVYRTLSKGLFFCRLSLLRDPKHNRLIFKWINIFSVKRPFVRVLFTPKPLCTLRFTYGTVCHWSVSHLVEGFFTKNGGKITHLICTFLSFSILIVLICDHTKIPCDHLFFLYDQIFKYSNIYSTIY